MDDYLTGPFESLTALFDALDVPYALIGGLAVGAWGVPRPTHDLDFVIQADDAVLPNLCRLIHERGYAVSSSSNEGRIDFVAGMPLIRCQQCIHDRVLDIDLFLTASKFQEAIIARRVSLNVADRRFWVATPEDLILLKLAAGRPRDMADIEDILLLRYQLDEEYLRAWAAQLRLEALLERVWKLQEIAEC